MAKRCLKAGCDKEVSFVCECKGKPIFMCIKHPSEHLISKGNHQIVGLLYRPDPTEAKDICKKFPDVLSKIRKIKSQALESTKMIIEQTLNLSDKLIKDLNEIEYRFCKLFKNTKLNKEIDIQDAEKFMNFADCDEDNLFDDLETVKKELTRFYDIDPFISSNYALYYTGSPSSQLFSLNLSNHASSPLSLKNEKGDKQNLQINSGFYLCSIDKWTNCIISSQNAYMIDLKQNQFKSLPNISISYGIYGLAYKDGIIYVFGESDYQQSYKLNLSIMNWESISSPPFYSNYGMQTMKGTASLIKNNIVLAGYESYGLYHYNDVTDTYMNVFNLSENLYNYSMQNWIVSSNNKIYENIGPSLSDFKSYANSITIDNLSVYGSFPYKNYIYFIPDSYSLMRINCVQKKIEVIQYKTNP